MKPEPLILIGGGGHCKACIDVIEEEGKYVIQGILDTSEKKGQSILNYSIVGNDNDIAAYISKGYSFFITIGQIKSAQLRKNIYQKLKAGNATIATVISPKAHVSKYSKIGIGTIIMHTATINAGAVIGDNCIINTGCNIEHDVEVGCHCHISTHAVVNGDCKIGDEVFIGSNSVLSNGIAIGNGLSIGAGAVVVKSIADTGIYAGNPARKIK
jgi:sugar O-acyltransferase (sialic acid O-acetyltransferase NeuD family)